MNRLRILLSIFPHADKVAHVLLGLAVTGIAMYFNVEDWTAFGLGMTAGLAKEMGYDYFFKGHVSWLDWFATIAGSLVAVWIF